MTAQEIMALATDYAQACYNLAHLDHYDAERAAEARAALQSALEAQAAEIERLKADIQTHQRSFTALKSDTDALQAKLSAMEAVEPVAWKCPDCGSGQKYDHRGCINRKNWNKTIRDSVDNLLKQAGFTEDSSARHQLAMMNFDEIKHEGEKPFGWWNATYNNFFPVKQISSGMSVEESPAYQRGELIPLYAAPKVAPLTDEQCRAKFEAWYASAPDAEPEPERTYELTDESMSELTKDCIWLGWQAAHGIGGQP